MPRKRWPHKPICTTTTCYCLDEGEGDPICDCGNPGWACRCAEIAAESGEDVHRITTAKEERW